LVGTPTYTMKESIGALVPASDELMKLPSGAYAAKPVASSGSLSNQPDRVCTTVLAPSDILVEYLKVTTMF
jgi:hypothetical protein